jgi:nitrate reductase gamma subunit
MLEKKKLALGSSLFHWGIFFVIGGHVMGILIPESLYQALGVSEHMYHKIAIGFGLPAGIAAAVRTYHIDLPQIHGQTNSKNELCR